MVKTKESRTASNGGGGNTRIPGILGDTYQDVPSSGVVRRLLAPRTAYDRLGRLSAYGAAAGHKVPLSIRNPLLSMLLHGMGGAAVGAVGGAGIGAGLGALSGATGDGYMEDIRASFDMPPSSADDRRAFIGASAVGGLGTGAGVGVGAGAAIGTLVGAWRQKKAADRLSSQIKREGVPVGVRAADRAEAADKSLARPSILTALLLDTGAHQRGRLNALKEMRSGAPAEELSLAPDIASLASVGYASPITRIYDALRLYQENKA